MSVPLVTRKTTPNLQKEIDSHRPKCGECNPRYVDLSATMCGCVAFTFLHKCRAVLVEVRILCDGCQEDMKEAQ